MNRFLIALMCLTIMALTACSGVVDTEGVEEVVLELVPDVESFFADGSSSVTFTVLDGEVDITDEAVIKCVTTGENLDGNTFTTSQDGDYVFVASSGNKLSPEVTLKALFASRFERKVCVMEFTGQWCSQCPDGARILNFLVSDTYKGKVHALAFHNDDDFSLPVEQQLAAKFNVSGYPYYVTDMRADDSGELRGNGCSDSIYKSLYETETFCGPSVTCRYDADSGKITATAKVIAEKAMEFRLAAYVVEDKVVAEQTLGTGSKDKNYPHRHVVRKMLSADYSGDRLGQIAAGGEVVKEYSFTADSSWNLDNVTVVVLAIDADGEVNNSASSKVK